MQNKRIKVTRYMEYTLQCVIQKWRRRATSANGWRTQRRKLFVRTSLKKQNCLIPIDQWKARQPAGVDFVVDVVAQAAL
ncbi:hypothetical protein E2986_12423 [Frieseomelitta varia]|uniref:Uncharacterized protein n=1 Tax=Frieseomelitta varia TaxID=561572 RepID=A0A833RHY5_9HYME|nr:hypothetical protein E2986_12423 [Frieseomelitta varia]